MGLFEWGFQQRGVVSPAVRQSQRHFGHLTRLIGMTSASRTSVVCGGQVSSELSNHRRVLHSFFVRPALSSPHTTRECEPLFVTRHSLRREGSEYVKSYEIHHCATSIHSCLVRVLPVVLFRERKIKKVTLQIVHKPHKHIRTMECKNHTKNTNAVAPRQLAILRLANEGTHRRGSVFPSYLIWGHHSRRHTPHTQPSLSLLHVPRRVATMQAPDPFCAAFTPTTS